MSEARVEVQHASGVEVAYEAAPKRRYEVRTGAQDFEIIGGAQAHIEATPWVEVPSVTTVLGVLDKPALPWWGMGIGIEGTLELHRQGVIREVAWQGQRVLALPGGLPEDGSSQLVVAGKDEVIAWLNAAKLTVNHVRDKAGDRGRSVHDAFELWATDGIVPDPAIFPPEERGYVEGLVAFLTDIAVGEAEPLAAEVMVASAKHGFAGRYDVRFRTHKPCQIVYHRTPVKGPKYATLQPGNFLSDLKTSSGVYPSHSRQLEAYELASVECGFEPTDARGIIHVGAGGTYEFVRSTAEANDFLCVLEVWRSDERMKTRRAK